MINYRPISELEKLVLEYGLEGVKKDHIQPNTVFVGEICGDRTETIYNKDKDRFQTVIFPNEPILYSSLQKR